MKHLTFFIILCLTFASGQNPLNEEKPNEKEEKQRLKKQRIEFRQTKCKIASPLIPPYIDADRMQIESLSFDQYLKKQNKQYCDPALYVYHAKQYQNNLDTINKHNSNPNRTYNMGINKFTDLNPEQWAATHANLVVPTPTRLNNPGLFDKIQRERQQRILQTRISQIQLQIDKFKFAQVKLAPKMSLETELDVLKQADRSIQQLKAVQRAKNQELKNLKIDWSCFDSRIVNDQDSCGCCYLMAIQNLISTTYVIYGGEKVPFQFSLQHILTCHEFEGLTIRGCCGGIFDHVLEFAKNTTDLDQPKRSGQSSGFILKGDFNLSFLFENISDSSGETDCQAKNEMSQKDEQIHCGFIQAKRYVIKDFKQINECEDLLEELQYRPVTVAINAKRLQFYKNGKYNGEGLNPNISRINDLTPTQAALKRLNHAILLLGYNGSYFAKNSWGRDVGHFGYLWIDDQFVPQSGICLLGRSVELYSENKTTDSCCGCFNIEQGCISPQ